MATHEDFRCVLIKRSFAVSYIRNILDHHLSKRTKKKEVIMVEMIGVVWRNRLPVTEGCLRTRADKYKHELLPHSIQEDRER